MKRPRRLVLVRHGETDGESSVRYHGSGDVALSEEGRDQMRGACVELNRVPFDLVVASPLQRAWQSAWILGRGAPVRLESELREVDFGRWEGRTQEEIRESDPDLFEAWQSGKEDFAYPGGESRQAFRERVRRGLERLLAADARNVLVVTHKGVIRLLAEELTGEKPAKEEPALGGAIELTRRPDGSWFRGRHTSNPRALEADSETSAA